MAEALPQGPHHMFYERLNRLLAEQGFDQFVEDCCRPFYAELFLAYVPQQLVPTLTPGDIVVLDNLSSHHRAGIREAIEAAAGTLAYRPPYSPDLNPIELLFSKLKSRLRKHAERSLDSLWTRIGQLSSPNFSPTNAATISATPDTLQTNHDNSLESIPKYRDGFVFHGPLGGRLKSDTIRNILVKQVIGPLKSRFPTATGEGGI